MKWNKGELDSYLIEITARHTRLQGCGRRSRSWTRYLDTAGQKGTGKWTGIAALDEGVPLTLIGEAVFARCLSAMKEERAAASKLLQRPSPKFAGRQSRFPGGHPPARCTPRRSSPTRRGITLMRAAAKTYGWNLNYGGIALMWRGGCIIRSAFLEKIKEAFDTRPSASEPAARPVLPRKGREAAQHSWRKVVSEAFLNWHPRAGALRRP